MDMQPKSYIYIAGIVILVILIIILLPKNFNNGTITATVPNSSVKGNAKVTPIQVIKTTPTPGVQEINGTPTPTPSDQTSGGSIAQVSNDNHLESATVTETQYGFNPSSVVYRPDITTYNIIINNQSSNTDFSCPGLNINSTIGKGMNTIYFGLIPGIYYCTSGKNPKIQMQLILN